MKSILAVYENGVFRPLDDVSFPNHTKVEIVPLPVNRGGENRGGENVQDANAGYQDRVYEILSQSFDTDQPDLAERHNEHQP